MIELCSGKTGFFAFFLITGDLFGFGVMFSNSSFSGWVIYMLPLLSLLP